MSPLLMNQKDQRILKLHSRGMQEGQIARKIGYADVNIEEGIQRVRDALERERKLRGLPNVQSTPAQYGVELLPKGAQLLTDKPV